MTVSCAALAVVSSVAVCSSVIDVVCWTEDEEITRINSPEQLSDSSISVSKDHTQLNRVIAMDVGSAAIKSSSSQDASG